jgi:hypothetical protein
MLSAITIALLVLSVPVLSLVTLFVRRVGNDAKGTQDSSPGAFRRLLTFTSQFRREPILPIVADGTPVSPPVVTKPDFVYAPPPPPYNPLATLDVRRTLPPPPKIVVSSSTSFHSLASLEGIDALCTFDQDRTIRRSATFISSRAAETDEDEVDLTDIYKPSVSRAPTPTTPSAALAIPVTEAKVSLAVPPSGPMRKDHPLPIFQSSTNYVGVPHTHLAYFLQESRRVPSRNITPMSFPTSRERSRHRASRLTRSSKENMPPSFGTLRA